MKPIKIPNFQKKTAIDILTNSTVLKGSLAVIDQAMVSGGNFLFSLLLARYLTIKEYGVFILGFSLLILFRRIQASLIISPMLVLSADMDRSNIRKYFGSLGILQLILSLTISILLVGSTKIVTSLSSGGSICFISFCAMAIASFSFQFQDFFRRMLFTQRKIRSAFQNDIVCTMLKFIGLTAAIITGHISVFNAFIIIFISSLIASLYGYLQCFKTIQIDLSTLKKVAKTNWDYGKWLLSAGVARWVSGQINIFLAAAFISVSATGVIGAVNNIYGVINVVVQGLRGFILPYASMRIKNAGYIYLKKLVSTICVSGVIGIVIYFIIAISASQPILDFLYNGKYNDYGYMVVLLGINALFSFLSYPFSLGLLLLKNTKTILYGNLFSSVVSIFISVPMVIIWGIYGACLSMIFIQATFALTLFWMYKTEVFKTAGKRRESINGTEN